MGHAKALLLILCATLLWSSAGVVSRQLPDISGVQMTFARSFFAALGILIIICFQQGSAYLKKALLSSNKLLYASGLCWGLMFSVFMLALNLTSVANVLITLAIEPLIVALMAWRLLGTQVPLRTWMAILVVALGMAWIYAEGVSSENVGGALLALIVPFCAASNWTLLQKGQKQQVDMLPAVFIGACLSALLTAPFALNSFQASALSWTDLGLLMGLGFFQLALPCALAVSASKRLLAHELGLLGMMEIIFGIVWAWWFAGETPSTAMLQGGAVVLWALLVHEWMALREENAERHARS